jgi:hypothetical protein
MTFAAIVASRRPRSGKTLLARLLAEHFILAGTQPLLFDTDTVEGTLSAAFGDRVRVIDLARVRDQVLLFDALAARRLSDRIVDLSHHTFATFFDLARSSAFLDEARAAGVKPIVFYLAGSDPQSFDAGRLLRDEWGEDAFVLVENRMLGDVPVPARLTAGYRALAEHRLRLALTAADAATAGALADPAFSPSAYLREPGELSAHDPLRAWLLQTFREIHRVMQELRAAPARSDEQARPVRSGEGS